MANVENQKTEKSDNGKQLQRTEPKPELVRTEQVPARLRDPLELTRDFWRWDPFRGDFLARDPFREMQRMMSEFMREFWEPGVERGERAWYPELEVRETEDEYVVTADVPGLTPDDLDVTASGNRLQIAGKREHKEEKSEGEYRARQRAYGSFSRAFELPDDVDPDRIQCKLEHGVLEVVLPKKPDAKSRKRKIAITSGSSR